MHFVADVEAILQRVSEATRGFDGEDGPRLQAATPPRQEHIPVQQVQQQQQHPISQFRLIQLTFPILVADSKTAKRHFCMILLILYPN